MQNKLRYLSFSLLVLLSTLSVACGSTRSSTIPEHGQATSPHVHPRTSYAPPALPTTQPGLHPYQIFDGGMTTTQVLSDATRYGAVWGSNLTPKPADWKSANPNMLVGYYLPMGLDANRGSFGDLGHNLAWWQGSSCDVNGNCPHPDWVLYQCDGTTLAKRQGLSNIPIIMTTASADWQWAEIHDYIKNQGYNSLDMDIVSFGNDGQACGTWADGIGHDRNTYHGPDVWTPFYQSGQQTYAQAAGAFIAELQVDAHSVNDPTFAVVINTPTASVSYPNIDAKYVIDHSDVLNNEDGFTALGKAGNSPPSWPSETDYTNITDWSKYSQNVDHEGYLLVDRWNVPTSTTDLTKAQIEWSLANYEIINDGEADTYTTPYYNTYDGAEHYYSEYIYGFGTPCWAYRSLNGGRAHVHYRVYTKGITIVNNGVSESISFSSDFGLNYVQFTDIEGQTLIDPLTMGDHTAILAYTTSTITCPP